MTRLVIRQLRATPARFLLTAFGVTLAVGFVVASLVIGDGQRHSLQTLADATTAGVDAEIRPSWDPEAAPLSEETVAALAAIDGVAGATARVESSWNGIELVGPTGRPIETDGPPRIATAWPDDPAVGPFRIVDGTPPTAGMFTIDVDSAVTHGLVVGERYGLRTPRGLVDLTMSGTTTLSPDEHEPGRTLGALLVQLETGEAASLLGTDGFLAVAVTFDDGVDGAAVRDRIRDTFPDLVLADRDAVVDGTRDRFRTEFTEEATLLGNVLLGFGAVSLFVSIFIVYNTFAIALGQRTRELALLRTIGAGPSQVGRAVLGEALLVGVVASVFGIPGGIAIARGIEALFNATGEDMPGFPIVLAPRTLIAALLVGIGVTLVAAALPAIKASTVPAAVALRGGSEARSSLGRTPLGRSRAAAGTVLSMSGLAAGGAGLLICEGHSVTVFLLAGGAAGLFLGATVLAPIAVGPVLAVVGWPLARLAGTTGGLARGNAVRHPKRTATTAAALMVGLALVTSTLIVGTSVKATFTGDLQRALVADYVISGDQGATFPLAAVDELTADTSVATATGFRFAPTRAGGWSSSSAATDFDRVAEVYRVDVIDGGYNPTATHPAMILERHAERTGLGPGDRIMVEALEAGDGGGTVEATIVGIYRGNALFGTDYLFDESVLDEAGDRTGYSWMALALSDRSGVGTDSADGPVEGWSDRLPGAVIETPAEMEARFNGLVDEGLVFVNVLMALAVVIALLGIANTMVLSIMERVREIGLVRAVGMGRRQVRRMIRYEAALVAVFGAVLGVVVGLVIGVAAAVAFPDHYVATLAVPIRPIAVLIGVAALAGVTAAALPARRAARIDVLAAIAR